MTTSDKKTEASDSFTLLKIPNNDEPHGSINTKIRRFDATPPIDYKSELESACLLCDALQSQLAERDAALAGLLNAEHCQHCQNQGWYADIEPNRNTGEAEQVQVECEWCYTTKNSFFNVRASLPQFAKQDAGYMGDINGPGCAPDTK